LVFHFVAAVDKTNNYLTIITAYRPTVEKWENGFKRRRRK